MQSVTANIQAISDAQFPLHRRCWGRLAYGVTAILAIAGIFTCWCDTPMIWDGSYQFSFSLIRQQPYFYLTRFHSYILWTPMIWLSHLTRNLTALKMAYGLPFTLAPAFSVLASWWIVRKRAPWLVLWAVFGAAAAPLPGQIFIINDSIFQQHMFWPVFLGLLIELEWPQMIALAVLVVFQFSHQIGLVLLSGGAGAAALMAVRDRKVRNEFLVKAAITFVLACVALWKIFHFPDSYAQREFTWEAAHNAWQWGVAGFPLWGLEFMWGAGLCLLLCRWFPGRWNERFAVIMLAALCIIGAAIIWTIWASNVHRWTTAANYRRWVVPLTIPFYLMAFVDQFIGAGEKRTLLPRAKPPIALGYFVAAVFAVVLSIQSIQWIKMTRRLMADVEACPKAIVPWSTISWTQDTAMFHWGTASYVFVLEGQTPRHMVLDPLPEDSQKQLDMLQADPPAIPLSSFTPIDPAPGPAGWFDFRPMLQKIRNEMAH